MTAAAEEAQDDPRTVVVIGAGTMGAGIAQACAAAGHRVHLRDAAAGVAEAALARIEESLRRLAAKDRLGNAEVADILARIDAAPGEPGEVVADADVVLEAVSEDPQVKSSVWADVGASASEGALLCSNTSSLSITALGTASGRPGDLCGLHFFNPVAVLPLVEVVRGEATREDAIESAVRFAEGLGKTPVRCEDRPGFLVNRLLIPYVNEAASLLSEGTADADAIDTAMKLGAQMPMGPLALADLIGLDVVLAVMENLHDEFGDPRYRPAPILRRLVRAGRLGRKTGRGFHLHGGAE